MRSAPILFSSALLVLVTSCARKAPAPPPTLAERADSISAVFETPQAYTPRVIDSIEIPRFLLSHPEFHGDSADITSFYQRRGYQYAWFATDTLSDAASSFLHLIGSVDPTASAEAAEVSQWIHDLDELIEQQDSVPMNDSARLATELGLTARFFRAADERYGGFVKRDLRELDWYIPRRKKNFAMLLDSLVAGATDLSPIEPVHPQYRLLKEQLKRYHALDTLPWPAIDLPKGARTLSVEMDSLIHSVRERLVQCGDLAVNDTSVALDSTLIAGVRNAQHRFGLKETGVVDAAVLNELNVPPSGRIRTLLVNMERLRWVPVEQAHDLILVNIPEFRMHVYEHDTLAWNMNVVVGAIATRTVIFSGDLSQVVLAPYWNIPQSIIRSEILPAVKRNVHYLDRKNMEVVTGQGVVPAASITWSKYTNGVPFTIRQRPGPGNALGQVKFLFPNQYSIYFHDTPAKDKFAHEKRAFSHGCIRLSDPGKLARYLLAEDSTWTAARVKAAMNANTETIVNLQHPRPVVLGYFTAWVDDSGRLNFRDDVYGHDAKLAAELFAPMPAAEVAAQ